MTGSFLTFLAISLVVIMTPGQDTALTVRNTLAGGRHGGVMTSLGVALGQAAWALATAAGVVAFLVSSAPIFAAMKLAGAGYLIYLGLQSLLAVWRGTAAPADFTSAEQGPAITPGAALRQGIVSNLGNPKMAVFFASLLPQFAPSTGASFTVLVTLGLMFCAMTFLWLAAYAVAVSAAGDVLRRPAVRRAIEAVTGTVLVAFGIRIATAP